MMIITIVIVVTLLIILSRSTPVKMVFVTTNAILTYRLTNQVILRLAMQRHQEIMAPL
jgi:hypothetical protein